MLLTIFLNAFFASLGLKLKTSKPSGLEFKALIAPCSF
jgi:hypothetical protein